MKNQPLISRGKSHGVRPNALPPISGTRQRCHTSPLLCNEVPKDLAPAIRQEKERKGIQMGREEVKLILFVDDTSIHVKTPRNLQINSWN